MHNASNLLVTSCNVLDVILWFVVVIYIVRSSAKSHSYTPFPNIPLIATRKRVTLSNLHSNVFQLFKCLISVDFLMKINFLNIKEDFCCFLFSLESVETFCCYFIYCIYFASLFRKAELSFFPGAKPVSCLSFFQIRCRVCLLGLLVCSL